MPSRTIDRPTLNPCQISNYQSVSKITRRTGVSKRSSGDRFDPTHGHGAGAAIGRMVVRGRWSMVHLPLRMLKVTRTLCATLSIATASTAAIGCGDAFSSGSFNFQMELRFFDTTLDSGYVLLTAEATGGTAEVVSLACTGILQTSGTSPLRDSTFVERGTADREVSEMCTASAGGDFTEGRAVTTIPVL